jgi:hygromycin-B 4-O-kinase
MTLSNVEVQAFLVERFGASVRNLASVGHGEWSKAFTFEAEGGEFVVRFSDFESDFEKDRVAAEYASDDLPIPRVLDIGTAFGGFYALSRRATGAFVDDIDGPQMQVLLPALFRALDAARLVDLSATTGYGIWKPERTAPHATWRDALLDVANDWPDSRIHGWRERLSASPTGSGPFELALSRLGELVEVCPAQRHLVHADLLNYNVLVADHRISAVLDWGNAMYADYLFDVAWFAFWAPWYPAWKDVDFAAEAARHYAAIGLDVPHLEARLTCYLVYIGLDAQAYNAFKGEERWPALEATARRTLQLAGTLTPRGGPAESAR